MIKKSVLFGFLLLAFVFSFGQKSNLVFFTEQGEAFYVVLNGVKQNADARTNIKISDLTAPFYKCKIIFKNTELGQLDKTVTTKQGFEFTYIIKKNKKDKWSVSWMNETPIQSNISSNAENIYQLSTSEPHSDIPVATDNTIQLTTAPDNQSIKNEALPDVQIPNPQTFSKKNMDFNRNKPGQKNENLHKPNHYPNNQRQITNAVPGYNGPFGCNHPMTSESFADVKTSIAAKSFENSKSIIAKQVISNNCITTAQLKEIIRLFDFESTRLEIAKYAYGYTYDKGNYYKINDAFTFESSITDLNNYIKKQK